MTIATFGSSNDVNFSKNSLEMPPKQKSYNADDFASPMSQWHISSAASVLVSANTYSGSDYILKVEAIQTDTRFPAQDLLSSFQRESPCRCIR